MLYDNLRLLWLCFLKVTQQHKIGIMYCKAGQSTEEEMYNNGNMIMYYFKQNYCILIGCEGKINLLEINFVHHLFLEEAGPAFNEFLDIIGERVTLKGFEGYRAQLDNRSKFT